MYETISLTDAARKQQQLHSVSVLIFSLLVAAMTYFFWRIDSLPVGISLFDFFLLILASFRLIRLFMFDKVMDWLRNFLFKLPRGYGEYFQDLLSCPWCTGIWVALGVSFVYFLTPLAWIPLFVTALAGAGSILQFLITILMKKANQE